MVSTGTLETKMTELERNLKKNRRGAYENALRSFRINDYSTRTQTGIKPNEIYGIDEVRKATAKPANLFIDPVSQKPMCIDYVRIGDKIYLVGSGLFEFLNRPDRLRGIKISEISRRYNIGEQVVNDLATPKAGYTPLKKRDKSITGHDFFVFYMLLVSRKYGRPSQIPRKRWKDYTRNGKPLPAFERDVLATAFMNEKGLGPKQLKPKYFGIIYREEDYAAFFYFNMAPGLLGLSNSEFDRLAEEYKKSNKQSWSVRFIDGQSGELLGALISRDADGLIRFLSEEKLKLDVSVTSEMRPRRGSVGYYADIAAKLLERWDGDVITRATQRDVNSIKKLANVIYSWVYAR